MMVDGLRMSTISYTDRRNDLHLTTTGYGHQYKPIVPFPTEKFHKERKLQPLPKKLMFPCVLSVNDAYGTTTGETFDYKHPDIYPQTEHKKAPSLLKVNYTLDTIMKLDKKPWRSPLTMGNQSSEMHDSYKGSRETDSQTAPINTALVDTVLQDHFNNGITKRLIPSDTVREVQGKCFSPHDQAVLYRLQPYMTTNNWNHRQFKAEEMKKYPKKDFATYWQCEDYPKSVGWGFGTETNPLPKSHTKRADPGPMTDRMSFRTKATLPDQLPKKHVPLSSWPQSIYNSKFTEASNKERSELFKCPVQVKIQANTQDTSLLHAVPKMYVSNNTTYGNHYYR